MNTQKSSKVIRIFNALIFFIAVSFIVSCSSSVKVSSDFDRMVDFSKYKTFSFYQLTDKGPGLSELNRDRIVNAIKAELIRKGMVEKLTNPDVFVNATTLVDTEKQITSNTYTYGGLYRPYFWGAGFAGSTTYNVSEFKNGSLVIDFIDGATNKLVWQGTGNKEIDLPMKDAEKIIPDAVSKILAKFPPQK
jgi:hypothetical protein